MKLMSNKKTKEALFYNRFVEEEKIKAIADINIQRKYWVYSFSIAFFCLCSATFPTFVGYNFENTFAIAMFCWNMFMYFWLFYFSIKFVKLDIKYGVFKNKKFLYIVPLPYILLSITFSIVAIFTTHFTTYPDTSFSVKLNPWFYFLIFIPLFLIYLYFCYYAFMKCFAKYTKSGRSSNRNI